MFRNLIQLIGVLTTALQVTMSSQYCSQDACFNIDLTDDGYANIQMEVPPTTGWVAMGVGQSMRDADMYISWLGSQNQMVLSNRKSTGHVQPTANAEQNVQLLGGSGVNSQTNRMIVNFRRLQQPNTTNASPITKDTKDFIWAVSATRPTSDSVAANIIPHSSKGTFTLDLSQPGSIGQATENKAARSMMLAHASLMFIAWAAFAPFGVFIARYFKWRLPTWDKWFIVHRGVMFGGVAVFTITAIVLGIILSEGNHFKTSHQIIGLVVLLAMACQIVLGFVMNKLWKPNRPKSPWYEHMHQWLGRSTVLLAWVNIGLGLKLVTASKVLVGLYIAWVCLILIGFVFGQALAFRHAKKSKNLEQVHHVNVNKDLPTTF
ncbi:hypothetical protein K7432_005455 [Basidiobolus ranarum]|uniref:Cytochrome b561 domain-containing protein n=1 Tax=Basidiobolus ranarum TaxID=34480 RepID=A0ABR2WWJ6_9FUNG